MGQFRGIELVDLTLAGPRVALRPWRADDAEFAFQTMQHAQMRRFLKVPDPYSQANADQFVTAHAHKLAIAGTGMELAITDQSTGELLGSAALRLPENSEQAADVGYWIAPHTQGQSLAAEAAGVLASWAISQGVARVEIRCEVTNLASARTALRAGFGFETIRRHALDVRGELHDAAVFVRLRGGDGQPIAPVFPALPVGGLTDGVIQVRATSPDDAAGMTAMEQDGVSVDVGFTGAVPTYEHYVEVTDRAALGWFVGPISAQMSIIDVETGAFAGSIQLRHAGPPKVAGIGYGVHPGFRGRGYTSRALRLVSEWAFSQAGYARLELGAKARNVASQKAAATGGFSPDGVQAARLGEPDGSFSDEVRFALVSPLIKRITQ